MSRASGWVGELFDEHVDVIHAYLSRRLGPQIAGDATSEVFRLALEHSQSYDASRGSGIAWLYGIAGNVVRRHWRTEQRRLTRLARVSSYADDGEDDEFSRVDARLDARSGHQSLLDAVAELPDADREILVLYAWESRSYREIADVVGVPTGTVRSRLHRIRRELRNHSALNEGGER